MNRPDDPGPVLREVARVVDRLPSVARRSSGVLGTAAAYLPGERITGVRLVGDEGLEIHVVMRWGHTVTEVETEVVTACRPLWDGTIDLAVDDIELPSEAPLPLPAASTAAPPDPHEALAPTSGLSEGTTAPTMRPGLR